MPNALELGDEHRGEKGARDAAEAADDDDDEDLDDDAQIHRVRHRLARDLERAAEPGEAAPTAKTLVKSHFWFTPRAATMSRSCVAARTRTPQRVRLKRSHKSPSTSGPTAMRKRS